MVYPDSDVDSIRNRQIVKLSIARCCEFFTLKANLPSSASSPSLHSCGLAAADPPPWGVHPATYGPWTPDIVQISLNATQNTESRVPPGRSTGTPIALLG